MATKHAPVLYWDPAGLSTVRAELILRAGLESRSLDLLPRRDPLAHLWATCLHSKGSFSRPKEDRVRLDNAFAMSDARIHLYAPGEDESQCQYQLCQ